MKAVLLFSALVAVAPAFAQDRETDAHLAQVCRMDIHLYCADARLRQECLVARWTKLTDACQNALVIPTHEGEGAKDQFGVPAKN